MKNKMSNLNDHLFAQLERLADESLTAEQIDQETKRGGAMVAVADQIIKNATVQLAVAKLARDAGGDAMAYLPSIEGRPLLEARKNGKTAQ